MPLGPGTVACELQRMGPCVFKGPGQGPDYPSLWGSQILLDPRFPLLKKSGRICPVLTPSQGSHENQKSWTWSPHQVPRATRCQGCAVPEPCTLCPSPARTWHLPHLPYGVCRMEHRGAGWPGACSPPHQPRPRGQGLLRYQLASVT